jgi:hypothetical protein
MNRKLMIPAAIAGSAVAGAIGVMTMRRIMGSGDDEYYDYDPAEGPQADTHKGSWTEYSMYQPEDAQTSRSEYVPDIPQTASTDPNRDSSWKDNQLYAPNERQTGEARRESGS